MKNKQEAKELFLKWLEDNGAERIKELECEEGFADQIHGYINNSICIAFFRTNYVTSTMFGSTYWDLTLDEFTDKVNSLRKPKKEYTLELEELGEDQQLVIKSKGGKVIFELRQNLN